jgi:hypothetical protein
MGVKNDLTTTYYYALEYTINFKDIDPYTAEDISSAFVIRCPFAKLGSFAIINLPLDIIRIRKIQDVIENLNSYKDLITITIKYYVLDHTKIHLRQYVKLNILTKKHYYIINCQPLQRDILTGRLDTNISIPIRLVIVNPLLYFLENVNMFNQVFYNKSAYSIIKDDFVNYLKTNFKDSFNFKFIDTPSNTNKYIYEQILTRAKSDMMVPKQLNDMFKTYQYPMFSFFDDFALKEDNDKDIVFYHVCLGNPSVLKKINIFEEESQDALYGIKSFKKLSFFDLADTFNDVSETQFTIRDRFRSTWVFNPSKTAEFQVSTKEEAIDPIIKPRKIDTTTFQSSSINLPGSFKAAKLYSPDEINLAIPRFTKTKDFTKKKILGIYQFVSNQSHCDYFQFDRIYNFDVTNMNDFSFHPISICNSFYRIEHKNTAYIHHVRTNLIKYNLTEFESDLTT